MMAWTEPKTWTDGSTITATDLNEQVRDNLDAAATVRSYTPKLLAVDGPGVSGGQAIYSGAGVTVGQYAQAGDLVYFTAAITPSANTWTGAGTGTGFLVMTTPTNIGVLLTGRCNLNWYTGNTLEASRMLLTPYDDFTGSNAVTVGGTHPASVPDFMVRNAKGAFGSWLGSGAPTITVAGVYLTDDSPITPGI